MGNLLTRKREKAPDLFAHALWDYYHRGRTRLFTEREDGRRTREDISWYFTSYRDYPLYEKEALKFARGHVLDVGCGAGRHALYLQRRGLHVTGIDVSPRIVELARARGVKDVRVANVCKALPFKTNEFDTVMLFGNNLGICGTPLRFSKMLRELARVTRPDARILGTTRLPRVDKRYTRQDKDGDDLQVRLRLSDGKRRGKWFDLLLLSPEQVWRLADRAGWSVEYLFGDELDQGYAVVLRKNEGI